MRQNPVQMQEIIRQVQEMKSKKKDKKHKKEKKEKHKSRWAAGRLGAAAPAQGLAAGAVALAC